MPRVSECKRCNGRPSTAGVYCSQCGINLREAGIETAKAEHAQGRLEFMKTMMEQLSGHVTGKYKTEDYTCCGMAWHDANRMLGHSYCPECGTCLRK